MNLELEDYPNLTDSLLHKNAVGAVASFDVRWRGVRRLNRIRDERQDFGGVFVEDVATIEWSARNDEGFEFRSDPGRTSKSIFAMIGRERNGRFF